MPQKHVEKIKAKSKVVEDDAEITPAEVKEDIGVDVILDEIDEVLEENAQEFVRSYIQQGGE